MKYPKVEKPYFSGSPTKIKFPRKPAKVGVNQKGLNDTLLISYCIYTILLYIV